MNGMLTVVRNDEDRKTQLTFKGIIDEESNFSETFSGLKPQVLIDLAGVKLINSLGVRAWIQNISQIPEDSELLFERCSIRIVEQINIVAGFLGRGKLLSFYAPYYCSKCRSPHDVLLKVEDVPESAPMHAMPQQCPTCGTQMEFDDIEEEYFSFLERYKRPS